MKNHSKINDKNAITYHYDVNNDFYGLFLGKDMAYSCAYFQRGDETLDQAQAAKFEYLCRKLRLQPGERLLDIGCGWGGLMVWAVKHYGVTALGITLSQNQYDFAKDWIAREKIGDKCQVKMLDYRELTSTEQFDKIVSVGMFEHVGLKNLPQYFKTIKRNLKERGLFLNHGITQPKKVARQTAGSKFISKHIFPLGELTSIGHLLRVMEEIDFEILDVESLRPHYAKTLRLWTQNLNDQTETAIQMVGEKMFRTWLIYLASCAFGFEKGTINIYQTLAAKLTPFAAPPTPLTRKDLYI